MPFIDTNSALSWEYDNTLGGIKRKVRLPDNIKYIKSSANNPYLFTQLKNYQFVTGITGSVALGNFSLQFDAPFSNNTISLRNTVLTNGGIKFYTYNSPNYSLSTKTLLRYGSNNSFTQSAIITSRVNELSFFINGFREFTYLDRDIATSSQPSGWFYDTIPGDFEPSYNIFLSATTSSISPSYSIFGSGLNTISRKNYIAKYIDYDTFNLDFSFYTSTPVKMVMYLLTLDKLGGDPASDWPSYIVGSFSTTGNYPYLGLVGTNYDGSKNYLVFSCDVPQFLPGKNPVLIGATQTLVDISCKLADINIYGTYHPTSNNRLALTDTTTNPIGLSVSNATYSYTLLNNGGTFSIPSRIGNGAFKSGIWENGVWNNGWRDDANVKDFDDVYLSILTASDVSWKIEIRGAISAIEGFATGSNVSIGNIVAIDINDNRKLLKDYYQIESLGVDAGNPQNGVAPYGWIRVNLDTSFPYRRIEKDSPNHKIKVTKNVWLSGGFFNGYFSGVWNNGLFKGYPLLTEMFDSHWIDGLFDGGRFNSSYSANYEFIGIGPKVACSNNFMDLTFPTKTPFLAGDYIFLTLDTLLLGGLGTNLYSGVCQIVDVKGVTGSTFTDGQIITINKRSIGLPSYLDETIDPATGIYTYPAGSAYRYTASSVIQNFKFYDNNRSRIKSPDSQLSSAVFNFNSWIDVNYDDTRSVTLGRDFRSYEPLTGKSVNRNNLYGYPTYDILSSASRFRDSNSLDNKLYKLGTKYKVFTDFIGDDSQFNEPFNDLDFSNFINAGWTYSYVKPSNLTLKRTETLITLSGSQSNALLNSGVTGDELYVTASNTGLILNNNNIDIKKSRYSVVEFDVITYSVANINYSYDNPDIYQIRSINNLGLSFSESIGIGYLTASYTLTGTTTVQVDDILVMVDIYGDVIGTTINLVAPNGKIINLKKIGTGLGNRLTQTKFSLREVYEKFSYITTPYSLNNNTVSYSDTYQMDKEIGQGTAPYLSDTKLLSELITDNGNQSIYGKWTLYVKYNSTATNVCDLTDWSIDIQYKRLVTIDNEPTSSFPMLNFSNLNYDITTQLSGYDNVQVYKKMNYLPISNNVNHLIAQNTFRLDSVELATPARWGGFGKNQKTKKYEYFYNKTDMMLNITGNGATGASTSMVVLDNLNMYEVDMIPFFKYFENANIYKGVVFPYVGTSPEIDYVSSDFVFVDNISIGLDSINPIAVDTTFINCGTVSYANLQLSARIRGISLAYTQSTSTSTVVTTTSYQFVNMTSIDFPFGSVTCSTTFDDITWNITSAPGYPLPSLTLTDTLYPLVSGLTAGGSYTITIESIIKNNPVSQITGPHSANITVAPKPIPVIGVIPSDLVFDFLPGVTDPNTIDETHLLSNYTNTINGNPSGNFVSSIKILSLPGEGTLVYNNIPITISMLPFVISIVGNAIPGLVYYPEGNPPTVDPQNSSFTTSFTYQIIDSDGNELPSPATMNIQANIPPSVITVNTPLNKNISYALSESDIDAAKYFTTIELLDGYTNIPNNSQVDHIKIQGVLPLRGELSYDGVPVNINDTISYADLVTGGHFAYYPQNIDRSDTTGGDFTETFTYTVLDAQLNESNLVTFDLDCTDVSSNIPFIPSGLTSIFPGGVPSLTVTVVNNGPMAYIWLGINNFYTGSGGVQAAVNASYGTLTLTNSVQNTTIYTSNYYTLNTGDSITYTLSANSPGNPPAFLPDGHYVAFLAYSYTIGGLKTQITN
jgi:hypothetical protein